MFRKLFVILLGIVLLGGFSVAEASHIEKLVLLVDTHGFATFDAGASGTEDGGFPFYVSGDICEEKTLVDPSTGEPTACTPIGLFHCWGWDTGTGLVVVSQEYDLFDKGKIQVQGVEDEGKRAVTGGTRNFKRVRGEATEFDFSELDTGRFIATFELRNVNL